MKQEEKEQQLREALELAYNAGKNEAEKLNQWNHLKMIESRHLPEKPSFESFYFMFQAIQPAKAYHEQTERIHNAEELRAQLRNQSYILRSYGEEVMKLNNQIIALTKQTESVNLDITQLNIDFNNWYYNKSEMSILSIEDRESIVNFFLPYLKTK